MKFSKKEGMRMALIDVYTDRNERTEQIIEKKEAHAQGLWHRVFTCLVINQEHKTAFLQKKTPNRYSFERPDHMDVTVGGHYEAGEDVEAGIREMREEIGIDVAFDDLVSIGERQTSVVLAKDYNNNEFQHIFLLPTKRNLEDFHFTDSEVRGLIEIPIQEGLDLMQGYRDDLGVSGIFTKDDGAKEIQELLISREDFVPAYLKTDEFMIRLFIAAKRYLDGEDDRYLYW